MAERMPPCWGATGQSNPADFMPQDFLWHKRSDGPTLLMPWAGERFKEWNLNGWRATLRQVPIERTRLLFPTDRQGEAMDFAHACGIARDHMIRLGTIRETLKLLSQASLLISVDTAAAHYAWLTGTPLVELFSASADVERWKSLAMGEIFAVAPGDRRHACSYREKLAGGMMDHIRPHDVAAAIRRRLG
jgi:ADP-heptose:LPS heptosyltransferase